MSDDDHEVLLPPSRRPWRTPCMPAPADLRLQVHRDAVAAARSTTEHLDALRRRLDAEDKS